MDSQRLSGLMKALTGAFVVYVISFAIWFFGTEGVTPKGPLVDVLVIDGIFLLGSAITFYILIGILASRVGKNWFIWVGGSLIFTPVGIFVAYARMQKKVESTIHHMELSDTP